MTIGEKTRYITINKPDPAVDGANQSLGWILHKKKWAQVIGQTGLGRIRAEASAGGVNTDLQRYSFRVNFDMSLTNDMQVVFKVTNLDGTFSFVECDVQSINHDHATRGHTDLVCQQGGSNG